MTRPIMHAVFIGALAIPMTAFAQHSSGGAPAAGTATPSAPPSAPAPAPSSSGASTSGSEGGATPRQSAAGPTSGESGRHRGNAPASGTAVRRGAGTGTGSGAPVVVGAGSGFYPWGYAYGAGAIGGYYGGYYGAYDPWYGWFPTYAASSYDNSNDTGSLRLKVKPNDASVYVDGFYVGAVDDFDGVFQRLRLEPGPHHIEIRAPQHQPLAVDVMIQEDFTITYRGELASQSPLGLASPTSR